MTLTYVAAVVAGLAISASWFVYGKGFLFSLIAAVGFCIVAALILHAIA